MSAVRVARVLGLCAVQDGGRRGHMHEGVPRGGALVPELLARANRFVGNAWDAPALEIVGSLRVVADTAIATEHGPVASEPGREIAIAGARYLAVVGGFDVPRVLGGRGALASASIGRVVRSGDVLDAVGGAGPPRELPAIDPDHRPIRVLLGPDRARFRDDAADTLLASDYLVAAAVDRVGMRLSGPPIARADEDASESAPMARGAIQVPASGEPIVLGPDHPTTGGYPVIATVIRADQGALAARPPGALVRFVPVTIDEARDAWRAHAARFFS